MAVRRPKHIPIRSCIVCRETSEKRALLRVVRRPESVGGAAVADETGKLSGRGAYVCATEKCTALAQKQKKFERALATTSDRLQPELFEQLRARIVFGGDVGAIGAADTNDSVEKLVERGVSLAGAAPASDKVGE